MVRRWRGKISQLEGNTGYRIRTHAFNAVGWSIDFTPELVRSTSDRPPAPEQLVCLRRHPTSATVSFQVEDPEGAPIHTFSASMHGVMGYSAHSQCLFNIQPARPGVDDRYPRQNRRALCILEGLQPETDYCMKLWAQNDAGFSKTASLPVQFRTAKRPLALDAMHVQVGPRSLSVEWEHRDPVGAPITRFELEYCKDSVFSSWESVEAKPIAVMTATGETSVEPAAIDAAVVVGQVLGATVSVRQWRVQLDGLDRETPYQLRARAMNCVGWAPSYSPSISARTCDRPPQPVGLACQSRLPGGVWLEVSVDEVLGTAPVNGIIVERSGTLSWQEVPDVEFTRREAQAPNVSDWDIYVPLGINPGAVHELRVWASNVFGRCAKPSLPCACMTSDRPSPPAKIFCASRLPHALHLEWAAPDPEGAPVWRFEVQCRKEAAFSSWAPAFATDTIRRGGAGDENWQAVLEQLDSAALYRVCMRAVSEVGFSDWSPEVVFETSGLPQLLGPPPPLCRRLEVALPVPTSAPATSSLAPAPASVEDGSYLVDLQLDDPEGAPVLACMVRCRDSGPWILARRQALTPGTPVPTMGHWRAVLPLNQAAVPSPRGAAQQQQQRIAVSVRAANAVGWSRVQDHRGLPLRAAAAADGENPSFAAAAEANASAERFGCGTLDLVSVEVHRTLATQQDAQERLRALLDEATERGDQEHVTALSAHSHKVRERIQVLQEVAQQVDPEMASSPGEDQGTLLTTQLQAAMQRKTLVPTAPVAATVLSLLLRGYMWLERSWRAELRTMSGDIAKVKDSIPESGGGVLVQWVSQHQAWSETFDRRVGEALPEGLSRAAQLLATLASGLKLELLETVRSDLEACHTLVSAAERQLRRLRHSHRLLCAAQQSSCHNFERKGVLRKIETTALGIVTMMVLPLPGTLELGTTHIGMLWLEGDTANSHVAVEHPSGIPLGPMLERLGSSPPPRAAVIIAGWANGGHRGVVCVHNATPRRIVVNVLPTEDTFASKAVAKLSEAHPFVKWGTAAMTTKEGGDSVVVIPPTDVSLLQVPDVGDQLQKKVRLEFSYGTQTRSSKAVGHALVSPGSAVSFMCLDTCLQVSNDEGSAENCTVEESTLRLCNNDLTSVSCGIYRAPELQKHFEGAIVTHQLEAGAQKQVPLPQPCIGRIFQVDVQRQGKSKEVAEVRPGQVLIVEGCG